MGGWVVANQEEDQTAEILPRLMMIELPCRGREARWEEEEEGGVGNRRGEGGQSFKTSVTHSSLFILGKLFLEAIPPY